jgi:hypothetical protein
MHARMISGIAVVAVVALALSAQPADPDDSEGASVATIVVPTGLDDDDVKRLHARINAQVAAAGGKPRALSRALEVKDECLDDPACAQAVLRAADAPWLLWVDALRAGPKVQIDARLLDAGGRVVAEGGGVVDVEEVLRGKTAVPAEVLLPLRNAPAVDKGPVVPPPERTQPPTALENPPPPLAIAGVVVATSGLLVSVVSLALLPSQFGVLEDSTSLGDEKVAAAYMVPTLISTAVGGVVVGGIGGALAFIAAQD